MEFFLGKNKQTNKQNKTIIIIKQTNRNKTKQKTFPTGETKKINKFKKKYLKKKINLKIKKKKINLILDIWWGNGTF